MSLRQIVVLATCIAAGSAFPTPSELAARAVSLPNFNEMAQSAGLSWFGCSIDTGADAYQDETYMKIFNQGSVFGQTTPGNTMKWQFTEPENGQFDFSEGEKTIDLAKQSGKKVRCHNLVWTEQLPDWVSGGSWTKDSLLKAMKTHITKEINHYGGGCYSWDVVNEAVNYDGSYTDNIFLQTIGEDYVTYAFQYAHEAVQASGADIKLFYNDYQLSMPGKKVNTVVNKLIPGIQSAGKYIDGIGLESHHTTSYYPTADQLSSVMSSYADLGLEIHITELDVACTSTPCSDEAKTDQAQAFYNTVSTCVNTEACKGITVWDYNDKYNWIQPESNDGSGEACMYAEDYTAKPAATAVEEALKGKECSVC